MRIRKIRPSKRRRHSPNLQATSGIYVYRDRICALDVREHDLCRTRLSFKRSDDLCNRSWCQRRGRGISRRCKGLKSRGVLTPRRLRSRVRPALSTRPSFAALSARRSHLCSSARPLRHRRTAGRARLFVVSRWSGSRWSRLAFWTRTPRAALKAANGCARRRSTQVAAAALVLRFRASSFLSSTVCPL